MECQDLNQYQLIHDPLHPLVLCYEDNLGNRFYVEPGFLYALESMKEKRREDFPRILKKMDEEIKENHKVVFTANYETPFLEMEGYIYREITDITDPLNIFVEDKSRGSDYGD